jgi:A/G-specific adenine glycosylase
MAPVKENLLQWYRENRRDLPWRRSGDPYKIWISEVMLQQTTVSVVMPYFEKFILEFPTVQALASAPEAKILSLWSGLGYYSRAKNLHKAAKAIAQRGSFPGTAAELRELPGIGAYTSAAVASIAFNEEIACIDGNVSRVISRIHDLNVDIASKEGASKIAAAAAELIHRQPPAEHNQAMMELGATICTPKNPACLLCPLMNSCKSLKAGTIALRPVKKKKRKQEPWVWTMFLIEKKGRIALVKNGNGTPWLKNTWVLPGRARRWTKSLMPKSDCRHSITHHKIFVQLKKAKALPGELGEVKWVHPSKISELGVSSVVQKILRESYTDRR